MRLFSPLSQKVSVLAFFSSVSDHRSLFEPSLITRARVFALTSSRTQIPGHPFWRATLDPNRSIPASSIHLRLCHSLRFPDFCHSLSYPSKHSDSMAFTPFFGLVSTRGSSQSRRPRGSALPAPFLHRPLSLPFEPNPVKIDLPRFATTRNVTSTIRKFCVPHPLYFIKFCSPSRSDSAIKAALRLKPSTLPTDQPSDLPIRVILSSLGIDDFTISADQSRAIDRWNELYPTLQCGDTQGVSRDLQIRSDVDFRELHFFACALDASLLNHAQQ
jgi:hypothetical protein